MPTVYSSAQWPLLQSKTEQKFKSGLFTVSAEFIRPVGNTSLPTNIETSIGDVNVWPVPTVSSGTDGFERINATGYGIWNDEITEEVFNISLYEMPVYYSYQRGPSSQGFVPESRLILMPVTIESVWVKKIGASTPVASRSLVITWPSSFSVTIPENGSTITGTPNLNQRLAMVKQNTYGQVKETEAVYEISPNMFLGTFYAPNAP